MSEPADDDTVGADSMISEPADDDTVGADSMPDPNQKKRPRDIVGADVVEHGRVKRKRKRRLIPTQSCCLFLQVNRPSMEGSKSFGRL